MSAIRYDVVNAAISRLCSSIDYAYNDFHKKHRSMIQAVLTDESLTNGEKIEVIWLLNKTYDRNKITYNDGTRRICENCNKKCLATLYCEYCVRNHLKAKFSNWTSGNDEIDKTMSNGNTHAKYDN